MFRSKILVNLISEIFGYPRKYGQGISEVEFNCPKCDKGRNKFNLVVNVDNLVFHCWACSYKGKVHRIVRDYGTERHREELNSFLFGTEVKTKREKKEQEEITLTGFKSLKHDWGDLNYSFAMKYLKSRRITMDMIEKWDICYSDSGKYQGRVIIPSKKLDGSVDYFIARAFYKSVKPPYKNPRLDKSKVIFGEKFIDWKKPITITEGVFDSMALYNSVPLLGSSIHGHKKLLKKILENKTPTILCLDKDAWDKSIKVAKYLRNLGVKVYVVKHNHYNDIAEAYEKSGKQYVVDLIRKSFVFDELEMAIEKIRG